MYFVPLQICLAAWQEHNLIVFLFVFEDTTCCAMDATWGSGKVSSVRLVQHFGTSPKQVGLDTDDNNWKVLHLTYLRSVLNFSRTINNFVQAIMLFCFITTFSRVKTNPKNAINEHFLPRFLDFIVWGHEHECLVDPQVLIILKLLDFYTRSFNYSSRSQLKLILSYRRFQVWVFTLLSQVLLLQHHWLRVNQNKSMYFY